MCVNFSKITLEKNSFPFTEINAIGYNMKKMSVILFLELKIF